MVQLSYLLILQYKKYNVKKVMKTTRLSEKLNNKRGASILVALVLFLVVTMTATLVLTATTANSGRLELQRAQECAVEYTNSLVSVMNDQISNTNLAVDYPVTANALKDSNESDFIQHPIKYISAGKTTANISTSTLFCADYINSFNPKDNHAAADYTVKASGASSADAVAKAYNGLTATIHLDAYEANDKNCSISGKIIIKKNNKNISTVKFVIPASIKAYKDRSVDWSKVGDLNGDGSDARVSQTGKVVIKWHDIVTY